MVPSFKTFVACAGLVTVVKNGWELTEKIQKKRVELDIEAEIWRKLHRARSKKLINGKDFDCWVGKMYAAKLDNDRKISYSCL
jgi:hypothetical protein